MIKKMLATLSLAVALTTSAVAMDLNILNKRVDENLVAVGKGCSGTLVNPTEGYVITAYHCIADAIKQVEEPERDQDGIVLKDGEDKPKVSKKKVVGDVPIWQKFYDEDDPKKMEAALWQSEIVARDAATDVAILKIKTDIGPLTMPLPAAAPITLAPKDYDFQRGKTVWAVGNPRGFYGTVTKGIISSYRDIKREFGVENLPSPIVQYDGGIYFGSSGGALYDDNGTYLGIGFAIVPGMMGEPLTTMGMFTPTPLIWDLAEKECIADKLGGTNPEKCNVGEKLED